MGRILLVDDKKAIALAERRQASRKMVDSVLKYHGAQRWIAIRDLWLRVYPTARQDHADAVAEAQHIKRTMYDPKFGRSRAALGLDHGTASNRNTSFRIVANIPESLDYMLRKFDPFNLMMTNGKVYKDNWRQVYKTFPEYVVVEKI